MISRETEAGVTLIETLVGLSIAALIGVAGFTLLDGVTSRDAQLSGRLAEIAARDRAFQLLAFDASRAQRVQTVSEVGVLFETGDLTMTWEASGTGLHRRIEWTDGGMLTQPVLSVPTRLVFFNAEKRALVLSLLEEDLSRIILVAPEPVR